MLTVAIIFGVYVAIGGGLYLWYRLWSRQTPEYDSARNFEDAIGCLACVFWPIMAPLVWWYFIGRNKD